MAEELQSWRSLQSVSTFKICLTESSLKFMQSVTASQLRASPFRLVNPICQDQAYLFPRKIPGTPPYREVIPMVKQLGIPT